MIIRSQDKKYTTTDLNLEIVTNEVCTMSNTTFEDILNGKETESDKKIESKIYNSVGLLIGTYSTEEKAIKVLDMMQEAYSRMEDIKCHAVTPTKEDSFCFQMPQDSEV